MAILPPPGGLPPPPPLKPPPPPAGASFDPPLLFEKPLPPEQPLPPASRDERGRFAVGNPGKPPGTRHRTTIAIEALMEGQWDALSKTAIAQALRGDTGALRLILDRIAPVRRGSAVEISEACDGCRRSQGPCCFGRRGRCRRIECGGGGAHQRSSCRLRDCSGYHRHSSGGCRD